MVFTAKIPVDLKIIVVSHYIIHSGEKMHGIFDCKLWPAEVSDPQCLTCRLKSHIFWNRKEQPQTPLSWFKATWLVCVFSRQSTRGITDLFGWLVVTGKNGVTKNCASLDQHCQWNARLKMIWPWAPAHFAWSFGWLSVCSYISCGSLR